MYIAQHQVNIEFYKVILTASYYCYNNDFLG